MTVSECEVYLVTRPVINCSNLLKSTQAVTEFGIHLTVASTDTQPVTLL